MIRFNMSRKLFNPILVITTAFFVVILSTFISKGLFRSFSTNITTQVRVGNAAPAFTSAPAESAPNLPNGTTEACYSSNTGAATDGDTITFKATATDPNGSTHSYYFLVCSTSSITHPEDEVPPRPAGQIPSCTGTTFCTSGATAVASGTEASCTYTDNTSSWSTDWYGIVCDNFASDQKCSVSQGSGSSGSPLFVNHTPAFSTSGVSGAANPGATFTWTTTSSDPDTSPYNNIKLLVCKTQAISAGACTGGEWCSSAGTETSNSTCGYVATSPYADGSYNAYPYIVDECNLASAGTAQGVNKAFTVNNVAPSVSSVTLNGGSAISLTQSTTTAVSMTASVTDNNGCRNQGNTANEISNVKAYLYRSGITYTGCDTLGEANNNNCYPEVSCSAGTCTNGVTTYTCSASLQHYADPTVASTIFATDNWLNSIKATDDDAATGTTQVTTGVEVNTTLGGDTTPTTIDFGTLQVGGENAPLDRTLTHNPTGNVGLDITVKANTATMCTNYSTCTGGTPISISNIKYALTSGISWSSGTTLTTSAVEAEVNIPKQTSGTVPTKQTWWGIQIPSNILPGVYNGLNVVDYVLGETSGW